MRTLHFMLVGIGSAVIAAAGTFALALGLLGAADAPFFAVASDSMAPQIYQGDLVVTSPPRELQLGDVVTFAMYGHVVTHRVVANGKQQGTFETRGDANPGNDPWSVRESDVIGTVHSVVTNAGWPLLWVGSAEGRLAMTALLLLAVGGLLWSWPRVAYAQAAP